MPYEQVIYTKQQHIAAITINRPEVLNAMQPQTCNELVDVFSDFIADPSMRLAIWTGAGEKAFCVGADLKYMAAHPPQPGAKRPGDILRDVLNRCNKPVLAAVNGYAVGGGFEWALRCDIVIAAEHAQFGLPEVKRGLIADAGGLYWLPRRIPYVQAMRLIMTGEFISAEEALRMGLINEVVPMKDLKAMTHRWVERILECAPLAVQASKATIRNFLGSSQEPDIGMVNTLESVRILRESEDYREGPKAFAEKRKPVWLGR